MRDLIMKAFDLPSNKVASFFAYVEALDVSGYMFSDCCTFANSLTWERPFVILAARELLECEDASGLQVIVGLICRASRECLARKRSVFSTLLSRVAVRMPRDRKREAALTPLHPSLARACASDTTLAASVTHLQAVCTAVACEVKDRAVESVFLQPALMTAEHRRDECVSMDVDVHGGPVFLALLEACLGIHTSRLGEYSEEAKGLADVLAAGYGKEVLKEMWADCHLGKSWRAIPACRNARAPAGSYSSRGSQLFVWRGGQGMSVQAFADQAVNPSAGNAGSRARLAVYLEAYCRYLSEGPFLQRLFNAVTVGSVAGGSADSVAQLQCLFEWMKAQPAGALPMPAIPPDVEDVRYWLWDMGLGTLSLQAARSLFSLLGVVQPAGWALVEGTGAAASGSASCPPSPSPSPPRVPPTDMTLSAAGDVRGGGTGREVLRNLHNESTEAWDKWVHPGYATASWVHARLSRPYVLQAYSLCSANDCPHRDPVAWRLLGKGAQGEGAWTVLHEYPGTSGGTGGSTGGGEWEWEEGAAFLDRWQWMRFEIGQGKAVSEVRLEITAVRQAGDCIQLGHWHLYGQPA